MFQVPNYRGRFVEQVDGARTDYRRRFVEQVDEFCLPHAHTDTDSAVAAIEQKGMAEAKHRGRAAMRAYVLCERA